MTTELQRLIDAARTARAAPGSIDASADHEIALVDYILTHVPDADAEEKRDLERAVVEAWDNYEARMPDGGQIMLTLDADLHNATLDLATWLVEHAHADAEDA